MSYQLKGYLTYHFFQITETMLHQRKEEKRRNTWQKKNQKE